MITTAERLKLCHECPHVLLGVCRKCGCFVQLKVKVKSTSCPIGKWSEIDD